MSKTSPSSSLRDSLTSRESELHPYRVARKFAIAGLLTLVITCLILGWMFRQFSMTNMIEVTEAKNIALATALSNSLWVDYAEYFNRLDSADYDTLRNSTKIAEINKRVLHETEQLPVLKIKIYNLQGIVVYSTDLSQVGQDRSTHQEFSSAARGHVNSELSFRDRLYAQHELITDRNVLSSYIPIRRSFNAPVEGVFELYTDVTPVINSINHTEIMFVSGLVVILLVIYGLLILIVTRTARAFHGHHLAQAANNELMIYQATHDPLTGLQNRKGFVETLQSEMQRTSQDDTLLALLYIDLDGFKQINDNFGHNYGDELLKDFAKKLSLCVRGGDTLTRIGGDEFTVIIKNVDHVDKVVDIAERIMKICDEPFRNNGTNSTYSLSMGIAFYPFEDVDAETLIHHADAAMYAVKDKSRNDYLFYSSELNRERQRRTTFEDQLALALSENQFQLVYQPKINIINSTMVGMEALLRWTHPVHGPVSPVDFIPMLEDSGKIVEVGEWVMRKACATTRCWHQAGMDHLVIAVNVSPVQFQHVNFLDTVKKVLDEEQFPAECLEIEVTEGCLMEDIKQCVHKLNALRDLGVRIAVDDFGTGYSSLSYLQQFPINTLKIDRSFVSKLYESRDNASIVTAIMALAHSMRLEVVAEGVEEPQELAYLSALGCQVIQGYLFSRPLPENEIRQFHIDEKVVHDKMRPMQNADLEVNTA